MAHEWHAVGAEPFSRRFGTPREERFWLVVMNADGSSGLDAQVRYEVGLAPGAGWGWLIGVPVGIGLMILGLGIAIRRPRSVAPAIGPSPGP